MDYRVIKELYNQELQEIQVMGVTDEKLTPFIKKYDEMIKLYKKLHPFKYLLIKIFPRYGNKF